MKITIKEPGKNKLCLKGLNGQKFTKLVNLMFSLPKKDRNQMIEAAYVLTKVRP